MPRSSTIYSSVHHQVYKHTLLFTIFYFYPSIGELVRALTNIFYQPQIESSQEQENGTRGPWPRAVIFILGSFLFGGTQQEQAIFDQAGFSHCCFLLFSMSIQFFRCQ
jgi:hypothetical protein